MNVVIVGTGYVGLTTGVALAYLGHKVACVDVLPEKIAQLNAGQTPIYEPSLEEMMALAKHNLTFTTSYQEAGVDSADVVFICVNTPPLPDGKPNLAYLQSAAESIGAKLDGGFTVIVNKSTVPIGSGNWVGALVQDAYNANNLEKSNGNFAIGSNPEFLREGSALHDTLYPDRIVIGAADTRALDILTNLYRPILNQDFRAPDFLPRPEGFTAVPMVTTDLASAELIKYAANAFLALKISYINEIAQLAEKVGADVKHIARGIGLDTRIGPRFLQAGIGWGGSCFGKDTSALVTTAQDYKLELKIVQAARDVNYYQRTVAVEKLLDELKILKGRTIALLGLAFKPHTDDLRDAPALDLAAKLIERGVKINAHDPVAMGNVKKYYGDMGINLHDDVLSAVQDADAVILVTEWPEYLKLDWVAVKSAMRRPIVLDGRNFLPRTSLEDLGFHYIGIGLRQENPLLI